MNPQGQSGEQSQELTSKELEEPKAATKTAPQTVQNSEEKTEEKEEKEEPKKIVPSEVKSSRPGSQENANNVSGLSDPMEKLSMDDRIKLKQQQQNR